MNRKENIKKSGKLHKYYIGCENFKGDTTASGQVRKIDNSKVQKFRFWPLLLTRTGSICPLGERKKIFP